MPALASRTRATRDTIRVRYFTSIQALSGTSATLTRNSRRSSQAMTASVPRRNRTLPVHASSVSAATR